MMGNDYGMDVQFVAFCAVAMTLVAIIGSVCEWYFERRKP